MKLTRALVAGAFLLTAIGPVAHAQSCSGSAGGGDTNVSIVLNTDGATGTGYLSFQDGSYPSAAPFQPADYYCVFSQCSFIAGNLLTGGEMECSFFDNTLNLEKSCIDASSGHPLYGSSLYIFFTPTGPEASGLEQFSIVDTEASDPNTCAFVTDDSAVMIETKITGMRGS